MTEDLYDALGVPKSASKDEIKRAYRRKAKAAHPDAGGSAKKFGAIATAHRILSDDAARARYDATGDASDAPDNTRAEALMLIDQLVSMVLTEPGWQMRDSVARMRDKLRASIREINANASNIKLQVREMDRAKKRFRSKGAANPIADMIDARCRSAMLEITKQQRAVEIRELALKILDPYEFEADVPASTATSTTILTVRTA